MPAEPTGTLNGTGQNNIPPFSRGFPPERDDVGIVPYISAELPAIQPGCKHDSTRRGGYQPPERYRD